MGQLQAARAAPKLPLKFAEPLNPKLYNLIGPIFARAKPMAKRILADYPIEEYKRRNERAKELMEKHGIDALLLFSGKNNYYYGSFRITGALNFMRAVIVPRDGEAVVFVPGEYYRCALLSSWVPEENVIKWEEHPLHKLEAPVDKLANAVKDMGLSNKVIGLELGLGMYLDSVTVSEYEGVKKKLPNAKFVDATDMIWEQRKIKTPWEQDVMRKLGEIAALSFKAGLEFVREGATERDLLKVINKTAVELGAHDCPMEGGIPTRTHPRGVYTPAFIGRAGEHVYKEGDMIMLDGGPCYKGYYSDMQRQAVIGKPTELVKKLCKQALIGWEAAHEIVKPGTKISDLFDKPVEAMAKYNPEVKEMPWSFMGHNIGLQTHEPPYLTKDEKSVLEPGMVLTVETPGYDIPKWREMGCYPEDIYLVTEDGCEILTDKCPRELWVK